MCLLFETIRVQDGTICNLPYHQQRVDRYSVINLAEYISTKIIIPTHDTHKLRITYSSSRIYHHEIESYTPKIVESLKLIIDNNIEYGKKFDDRTSLNNLMTQREGCECTRVTAWLEVSKQKFSSISKNDLFSLIRDIAKACNL